MTNLYDTVQKVKVVDQTTGRYNILLYEVEESGSGYMYGIEDMIDHFYVDEVEYRQSLNNNTVKQYNSSYEGEDYGTVIIESERIEVHRDMNSGDDSVILNWSKHKNSAFEE